VYSRILLPVADAPEVEPMIRFAANLLDADGEIRVLHVIPATQLTQVTREWRASVNLVVPAHEAGAALDVRVEPEVRAAADVPGEILESAEAHDADAILMPLRGDRRSRNPFVGHTVSGILHHAHADVLILNGLALAADRIPRILLPSLRATPAPKAMRVAEELAIRNGGVPVVALALSPRGVTGGGDESRESTSPRGITVIHRRVQFAEARFGRRHQFADLLLHAAARERYGLVLVGGDEGASEGPLLTRRFLEELFRAAPCPVLALRA
jgi:nucleotide-binding universal stress UspA family protein